MSTTSCPLLVEGLRGCVLAGHRTSGPRGFLTLKPMPRLLLLDTEFPAVASPACCLLLSRLRSKAACASATACSMRASSPAAFAKVGGACNGCNRYVGHIAGCSGVLGHMYHKTLRCPDAPCQTFAAVRPLTAIWVLPSTCSAACSAASSCRPLPCAYASNSCLQMRPALTQP
jgi:hypothetical protein